MNNKDKPKIIKKSVVVTPDALSSEIYKNLKRYPFKQILDIGAWDGGLSKPFTRKKNSKIIGLDITDEFESRFDHFIHKDFLQTTKKDFHGLNIDLVLTNPPFGKNKKYNDLYPNLFIKKIFELFGDTMPVIMIVGHWFLSNSNKRIMYLNKANITRITTLHKSTFEGFSVESNVLYFNIKQNKAIDFFKPKIIEKKQRFKTVAFSDAQMKYVKENMGNFSGEVKELIASKYPDFP